MTIVHDAAAFKAALLANPPVADRPATARAVMLVEPTGFRLSTQSASDNAYMDLARSVDPERALAQHRVLAEAIRKYAKLPVQVFVGDAATPDAVFPNNVFATAPGHLVVGAMKHPERQRESQRDDIPRWFADAQHYSCTRLDREKSVVTELTGPLIIDRARGIGLHGTSERLNEAGVIATHEALDLRLSYAFPLAPGEYHTNVVMSVLASRALVVHEASLAEPGAARAIATLYGDEHVLWLDDAEKAGFVGNCIALTSDSIWMSATAERALGVANRARLRRIGFDIYTVQIDEIEKAGGSLRCCIAEIF